MIIFRWMQRAAGVVRSFAGNRRGGIAVAAAFIVPAVSLAGVGAIQIGIVSSFRQRTADAADAAALYGAQQLSVTPLGVTGRVQTWALAQLGDVSKDGQVQVTASQVDARTIRVSIDGRVTSFFGNALPPGGFSTHAEATAQALNSAPLCVLVFGTDDKSYTQTRAHDLHVDGRGSMSATGCAVYSDQEIQVAGDGKLVAADVQAVRQAHGPIMPTPQVGAPYVPDPFGAVNVDFPSTCSNGPRVKTTITVDTVLPAGLHCDQMVVESGARVTLGPGEHYFAGDREIDDTSELIGDDVVLDFDKDAKFDFKGTSSVTLNGRKSGPLAGFVIVCDRANDHDFTIESDHVSSLVGTIYIPMAKLVVSGANAVARNSPWTVVVAQSIQVQQASLIINSDYATSTVPVPAGVGPNAGAKLIQ